MEEQKVAVVTGGASGIGKCISEEFRKQGAKVYVIDKTAGDHYVSERCCISARKRPASLPGKTSASTEE